MSRFSTISSQHSALRELERQRLERLMEHVHGQADSRGSSANGSGTDGPSAAARGGSHRHGERRFQPLCRRDWPAHGVATPPGYPAKSVSDSSARGTAAPRATVRASPPSSGAAEAAEIHNAPGPGPSLDVFDKERAPSVEMAWLLRLSGRMDEEAAEVAAFLARHDLDRYASLLIDEPGAPGNSLHDLRSADDEALAQAGLPPQSRARLRAALQAELDEEDDRTMAPAVPAAATPQKWGRLGRVPAGWCRMDRGQPAQERERPRLRSAPVVFVDSAVGDDESKNLQGEPWEDVPEVALAVSQVQTSERTEASPARASSRSRPRPLLPVEMPASVAPSASPSPVCRPGASAPTGISTHSDVDRRPSSAYSQTDSRPGTSSGSRSGTTTGEKACCYQCYRQVRRQFAITPLDGDSGEGPQRLFCSEACVERCQEQFAAQDARARQRARQLGELGGAPPGDLAQDGIIVCS